jgi:ribonuclease Z
MKITILGNNSALPAYGHFPTAQVIEINEQLFLMDCGEGAQMRMQQFSIRSTRINHIFISHLHGDHFYGLIGFVSSLSLWGREKELHIYCPAEIRSVLEYQLKWDLGFPVIYHIIGDAERTLLIDEEKFEVSCFPVYHSVPTHGFKFIEKKRKRILIPQKLQAYEIPKYFYKNLTEGDDYLMKDGSVIKNDWFTIDGHPNKVYVFCADSRYAPEICDDIMEADLLYHESTYLDNDQHKATERFHSTAKEAAQIARQSKAKKLLLGHFSSKYKDLQPFLDEASTIFEPVELAIEGTVFEI